MVGRRTAKVKFIFHLEQNPFCLNERVCTRESSPVQMQEKFAKPIFLEKSSKLFYFSPVPRAMEVRPLFLQIVVQICKKFIYKFFKFFPIFCAF
jgi:hypothetical protein